MRDALASIGRQHAKHARSLGPEADWRALLFDLRCEVERTRLVLHRVTKLEIVEQLADVYFELTGKMPNLGYTCSSPPTLFERLGDAVFDGEPWRSSGNRYVVFQLAEVAVPRALFAGILCRIDRLRPRLPPVSA